MTESEQIAAFIARKGVTRIPEGQRTLTEREIYLARRGEKIAHDPINERHVVVDHLGREHVRNGLGEWLS